MDLWSRQEPPPTVQRRHTLPRLQSNAHIQKMIASALRLEAARLGHDTMTVKRSATFTRESRSKTTELNR